MIPSIKLTIVAVVGSVLLAGFPCRASAQSEDVSQKNVASLELEQADVREAIRALFKNVAVSYSVGPDVQGTVTVSLRNITFETALQNILRQVDATYRVEGGLYEIVRRSETPAPTSSLSETAPSVKTSIVRRIRIRSADPAFIAAMLGAKAGSQNYDIAPEMSTIVKTSSSSGSRGGSGGGLGSGSGSGNGFGGGGLGSGSSGNSFGGSSGGSARG